MTCSILWEESHNPIQNNWYLHSDSHHHLGQKAIVTEPAEFVTVYAHGFLAYYTVPANMPSNYIPLPSITQNPVWNIQKLNLAVYRKNKLYLSSVLISKG